METQFRLCPVNGSLFGCLPDVDGDCVSDSQVKFLTVLYVLGYCKSQLVYFSSGILFSNISVHLTLNPFLTLFTIICCLLLLFVCHFCL